MRARDIADVAIFCAGVEGAFAIDDAYVAGRLAAALGGEHDDSAVAAVQLASVFAGDEEGIGGGVSAANIRNANLDEDIPWCAAGERARSRSAHRRARRALGQARFCRGIRD